MFFRNYQMLQLHDEGSFSRSVRNGRIFPFQELQKFQWLRRILLQLEELLPVRCMHVICNLLCSEDGRMWYLLVWYLLPVFPVLPQLEEILPWSSDISFHRRIISLMLYFHSGIPWKYLSVYNHKILWYLLHKGHEELCCWYQVMSLYPHWQLYR